MVRPRDAGDAVMVNLDGMTQAVWNSLSERERQASRDLSGLTIGLLGLEGKRVEVCDEAGEVRRFWVGRSTGWRPCHIEVKTRRSMGGFSAARKYRTVRVVDPGPR
jgi:hypothetical protein